MKIARACDGVGSFTAASLTPIFLLLVVLAATASSQVVCPTVTSSKCTCGPAQNSDPNAGLRLYCKGLNDAEISSTLKAFATTNVSSSLVELLVFGSQSDNNPIALTKVPVEILKFESLSWIELSNNKISSIPPGAFNFPNVKQSKVFLRNNEIESIYFDAFSFSSATKGVTINLENNKINNIFPNAFQLQGDGVYTSIDLSYNKNLARFNANVFKPVLQKMKTAAEAIPRVVNVGPMGISVYLTKTSIDCDSDNKCHFAWLIRDNPQLIPYTAMGVCKNKTPFTGLKPADYTNCPKV